MAKSTPKNCTTGKKKKNEFDLTVIGSGPAGLAAAMQASKLGKKTAIIEENPQALGGSWLQTGTIPSKTLREVLATIHSIRPHVGGHWVNRILLDIDSSSLIRRAREVSKKEEKLMIKNLDKNNIPILSGRAYMEDRNTIRITPSNGDPSYLVSTDYTVIATGSKPRRPSEVPFDGWRIVDSDDILRLETLPSKVVIFGAGVIGCEYACMFGALGIETILIDARSTIMQYIDQEIVGELKKCMMDMGIQFRLGQTYKSLEAQGPSVKLHFENDTIETDLFFFAAGRVSSSKKMGIEKLGIINDPRGTIQTNEFFQTEVHNIYACGDVIGPPALACTSLEQGRIAANHALDKSKRTFPKIFPIGVYTIPELSSVGKTEEEVIQEGIDYVVGEANYDEIARGYIRGDVHGLIKIIVDKTTHRLIGVHIVGADAANLIHIGQCIMLAEMPVQTLVNLFIFNYPTLTEGYRVAGFNAINKLFPEGTIEEAPSLEKSQKKTAA